MRILCTTFFLALSAAAQSTQAPPVQPGQLENTISAPPLTPSEAFHFRVIEQLGTRALITNAIGAAFSQWSDTPSAWGRGFSGYADRFGSGFGQTLTRQSTAWAIEHFTHTDPRYFPSTETSWKPRLLNAVKQIYLSKRDDGASGFAYGKVISALAAGQVPNAWEPSGNNSFADGLERAAITLAVDGAQNLGQEVFSFARPRTLRHRH